MADGNIYNAIILMTVAFASVLDKGGDVRDGRLVARHMRNITFLGHHGEVAMNPDGEIVSFFTLLDFDPVNEVLRPVIEFSQKTDSLKEDRAAINWPNDIVLPPDECAFEDCEEAGKSK